MTQESKYDKEDIINRLTRKGLKPQYDQKTHRLTHFSSTKRIQLGIKCLGYLDFLKVPVLNKR
jgi:hypothetical protein